jgi:hypothetical protein
MSSDSFAAALAVALMLAVLILGAVWKKRTSLDAVTEVGSSYCLSPLASGSEAAAVHAHGCKVAPPNAH